MRATVLVIFDCDGVLVDSEQLTQRVEIEMITALGWPITVEEIHDQHLGRTVADVVRNIERHTGRPLPADFLTRREERLTAMLTTELEPVPGVVDALGELQTLGYASCVASSGAHEKIRTTLGHVGLYERFDGRIFSAQDVGRGKPWPDLFLHASRRMGYPPERCVVVEDSPAGVAAANAAGMVSVGYAGQTPAALLRDARTTIDSMDLLVPTITSLAST